MFNAHLPTIKANLTTKTLNVEYICTGVAVLICSSAIFKTSDDVLHRYFHYCQHKYLSVLLVTFKWSLFFYHQLNSKYNNCRGNVWAVVVCEFPFSTYFDGIDVERSMSTITTAPSLLHLHSGNYKSHDGTSLLNRLISMMITSMIFAASFTVFSIRTKVAKSKSSESTAGCLLCSVWWETATTNAIIQAELLPRLSCTLPEQLAISHWNQSLHALMDQVLFWAQSMPEQRNLAKI